jgi:hypothetical protein
VRGREPLQCKHCGGRAEQVGQEQISYVVSNFFLRMRLCFMKGKSTKAGRA